MDTFVIVERATQLLTVIALASGIPALESFQTEQTLFKRPHVLNNGTIRVLKTATGQGVQFLSCRPPCIHMIKTGITKNVPFVFFFLGLMNGAVGLVYGILVSNATILYINALAVLLSTVCVISYIAVSRSKSGPMFQVIGGLTLLLINHLYCVNVMVHEEDVTQRYGQLVFIISFILLTSPALEVIECMKEKNSEGMSVGMIIGNLSCSFAWLFYGLLLKDFFIYAPNIAGVSTNFAKGVVKVLYGGRKDKTA